MDSSNIHVEIRDIVPLVNSIQTDLYGSVFAYPWTSNDQVSSVPFPAHLLNHLLVSFKNLPSSVSPQPLDSINDTLLLQHSPLIQVIEEILVSIWRDLIQDIVDSFPPLDSTSFVGFQTQLPFNSLNYAFEIYIIIEKIYSLTISIVEPYILGSSSTISPPRKRKKNHSSMASEHKAPRCIVPNYHHVFNVSHLISRKELSLEILALAESIVLNFYSQTSDSFSSFLLHFPSKK